MATDPGPVAQPSGGASLDLANLSSLVPDRTAIDIMEGACTVTLGSWAPGGPRQYRLRVLPIAANRRWQASLEGSLVAMLESIDAAGDQLGVIMNALQDATPALLDALIAYDTMPAIEGEAPRQAVLPSREEIEVASTDSDILMAMLAVMAAANPFAGVVLGALRQVEPQTTEPTTNGSSTPTSTAPPRTAGRRPRSKAH